MTGPGRTSPQVDAVVVGSGPNGLVAAITLALIEVVRQANRPVAETRQETTVIEAQAEVRDTRGASKKRPARR